MTKHFTLEWQFMKLHFIQSIWLYVYPLLLSVFWTKFMCGEMKECMPVLSLKSRNVIYEEINMAVSWPQSKLLMYGEMNE